MDPLISFENLEQMVMALEPRRERSQFTTLLDTNCNQPRIPWSRFHVTRVQWHSLQAKE